MKYFGHIKRQKGLDKETAEGKVRENESGSHQKDDARTSQIRIKMVTIVRHVGRIELDRNAFREADRVAMCRKRNAT